MGFPSILAALEYNASLLYPNGYEVERMGQLGRVNQAKASKNA